MIVRKTHRICTVLALTAALFGCQALPRNPLSATGSVGTSIADAYPTEHWLGNALQGQTPQPIAPSPGMTPGPGYYTMELQSFCLHAGAYGPTRGSGYEIGPVLGRDGPAIVDVLRKAARHPEIRQADVQRLVWLIEAHGVNRSMDPRFAARVAPLLTGVQSLIPAAESQFDLGRLLPGAVRDALGKASDYQHRLSDLSVDFASIERTAVPLAPPGLTARTIDPGHWAYAGHGYFVRAFPHSYQHTTLELMRPAPTRVVRDGLGRLSELHSGTQTVRIRYASSQPRTIAVGNGPALQSWKVASIRLSDAQGTHTLHDFPDLPAYPGQGAADPAPASGNDLDGLYDEAQQLHHYYDQLQKAGEYGDDAGSMSKLHQIHDFIDHVDDLHDTWEMARDTADRLDRGAHPDPRAMRDFLDTGFYYDGLRTAMNITDFKGKSDWLRAWSLRSMDMWTYATCVLAGRCAPPGMDHSPFDPSGLSALPGDTSWQRLGLSLRRYPD